MSAILSDFVLFSLCSLSIVYGQSKLCISGSFQSSINGVYDQSNSTYYNQLHNAQLSTQIKSDGTHQYYISQSTNSLVSYCAINASSNYTFNPTDCYKTWNTYSNVYDSYVSDPNMRLITCDNICISRNYFHKHNGIYNWSYYNTTISSSVYYCQHNHLYVYGYIDLSTTYYWWFLSDETDTTDAYSSCWIGANLSNNYIFNLDDCTQWNTVIDDHWQNDTLMVVNDCTETTTSPPWTTNTTVTTEAAIYEQLYTSQELMFIMFIIIGLLFCVILTFVCGCCFYTRQMNKKFTQLLSQNEDMQYIAPQLREQSFPLKQMSSIAPANGQQPGSPEMSVCDESEGRKGQSIRSSMYVNQSYDGPKDKKRKNSDDSDGIYGVSEPSKDGGTTTKLTGNSDDFHDAKVHEQLQKVMDDSYSNKGDIYDENVKKEENVLFHMIVDV